MSTQAKKRRLRRRLVAAGLLVTALTAWTVPAAEAHPTGVPATGSHVRAFHPNPRDRASFYQGHTNGPVTPIVQTVTKPTDTGFAWGDAGIGAAFVAVAAGLLGAIQATRTRRSIVTRDPSTGGAA